MADRVSSNNVLNPNGRSGRLVFAVIWLADAAVQAFFGVFLYNPVLMLFISLAMLYVAVVISIRRLHDLNLSGWIVLVMLVPIVNILALVYLLFAPGKDPRMSGAWLGD